MQAYVVTLDKPADHDPGFTYNVLCFDWDSGSKPCVYTDLVRAQREQQMLQECFPDNTYNLQVVEL